MATLCFSPPESRAGLRLSRCSMPSVSTTGRRRWSVRPLAQTNAEQQVLPDAEMREELGILEHEPDPAPIGRHEDRSFGIHQHAPVKHDRAAIGTGKPRDQIDRHRFARTGPAEQGGDARAVLEGDIEIEGADLQRNVHADHAKQTIRLRSRAATIACLTDR